MSAARGSLGIKSLRSLNLRAHPTKSCKGVGHLQKPTLPRGFGSRSVMAQSPRVEPNRTLTKKKTSMKQFLIFGLVAGQKENVSLAGHGR